MRIMGIDHGKVRIGIALSDSLMLCANPSAVIKIDKGETGAIRRIREIANTNEVSRIVLGYPKNMNNTLGERAVSTEKFAKKLEKLLSLPVILWDERLSSSQAERALLETDMSRKKRKERIDGVAAALILQSYLDSINNDKAKDKLHITEGRLNMDNKNNDELLSNEEDFLEEMLDEEEEFDVITLEDGETGESIELVIIDEAKAENCSYLLVVALEDFNEEQPDASIIKEFRDEKDEAVYEIIDDDEEFEIASRYFEDDDEYVNVNK